MKKKIFSVLSVPLLFWFGVSAQLTKIREMRDHNEMQKLKLQPAGIQFDVLDKGTSTPNAAISLEPKDGDYVVYHPTPGFTSTDVRKAQLSILAFMHNKESNNIDLDKVVIEYKKNNQTISKTINLPADQQIVEAGYVRVWQTSRPYHENGDL